MELVCVASIGDGYPKLKTKKATTIWVLTEDYWTTIVGEYRYEVFCPEGGDELYASRIFQNKAEWH